MVAVNERLESGLVLLTGVVACVTFSVTRPQSEEYLWVCQIVALVCLFIRLLIDVEFLDSRALLHSGYSVHILFVLLFTVRGFVGIFSLPKVPDPRAARRR